MDDQKDKQGPMDDGEELVVDLQPKETESESVKGGEDVSFSYGAPQVKYTPQSSN